MPKTAPHSIALLAGTPVPGESARAIQACNAFLRLGPGRTLPGLLRVWAKSGQDGPPTTSLKTLKHWSEDFHWAARGAEYDKAQEEARNLARQRTFQRGLALDYRRVRKLLKLATFLEEQIFEEGPGVDGEPTYPRVWLADVKQIGWGDSAERVDIERFNGPLIAQYREVLDDLAKETGGRVRKQDVTTAGKPLATLADLLALVAEEPPAEEPAE